MSFLDYDHHFGQDIDCNQRGWYLKLHWFGDVQLITHHMFFYQPLSIRHLRIDLKPASWAKVAACWYWASLGDKNKRSLKIKRTQPEMWLTLGIRICENLNENKESSVSINNPPTPTNSWSTTLQWEGSVPLRAFSRRRPMALGRQNSNRNSTSICCT